MAHRHVRTRRLLEQTRLVHPHNRKDLLRYVVAKNIAPVALLERIWQFCDGDPYLNVMKELRSHCSKSGILINIGIVDILRRWQIPKSTGILKLAKAGYAEATLDAGIDFYVSRIYKPATDDQKNIGRLKDKVEFGRYKYR